MSRPTLIRAPRELQDACEDARRGGARVGVVPTMGALHRGHLALAARAAAEGANFRVVTIFVNPKQFGPNEDLARYPRTLEADMEACARLGVDVVFAPPADAMYPSGFATEVRVGALTETLEGACRPGHFEGVTTVVAKLLTLVGRCVAIFGRKDYQQWRVLSRMVSDLGFPVEMVGHPVVREPDGLALSSRNRYLDADSRRRALCLVEGLRQAQSAYAGGERDPRQLEALARAPVEASAHAVDYVALRHPRTLSPLDRPVTEAVVLIAAHVAGTRLIDNHVLSDLEDEGSLDPVIP